MMSEQAERLKAELLQLPIDERAEVARYLLQWPPPDIADEDEATFVVELERRMAEFKAGKLTGMTAYEVYQAVCAKYVPTHKFAKHQTSW